MFKIKLHFLLLYIHRQTHVNPKILKELMDIGKTYKDAFFLFEWKRI